MTSNNQQKDHPTDVRRGQVSGGGPNPWTPEEALEMIREFSSPADANAKAEEPERIPAKPGPAPDPRSAGERLLKAVPAQEPRPEPIPVPRDVLQEAQQNFVRQEQNARAAEYLRKTIEEYETSPATNRQQLNPAPQPEDEASAAK